jgi:tetratricopeptide (TPR) repeat protein
LTRNFGKYQVVEFQPPISSVKYTEYLNLFYSKAIALLIVIGLFFLPSLILKYSIKLEVTKHKFSGVITTSKIYFMLYPKNEEIYDYCAYAKYRQKDFEGAIKYYTTVLNLSGKTFTDKDFPRLANLLYLKKTISSPNDAIDLFNEYSTKKNASILQNSQLLWVKSIFRIENNITEGIIQDYEDLLSSIDSKDTENWFYISSDEAYILYLMREYSSAIAIYNIIIAYAETHKDKHVKDLKTLYAERGFAKRQTGDNDGANADFILSKIEAYDLAKYEPSYSNQEFLLIKH